MIVRKDKNVY